MVDDSSPDGFRIFTYQFDFSESHHDWQAGFSDFPVNIDSTLYEFKSEYTEQTPGTNGRKSIMLSANNQSDDLFMYMKRSVDDLEPNTEYILTFEVEFASDATAGVTGSSGESVYVKVGGTAVEPKTVIESDRYVMNIDKGNQGQNGENMVNLGNITISENATGYTVKTLSNTPNNSTYNGPITVKTNSHGQLWLIVGTDSGFKGKTTMYYTKVSAVFSKNR